MRITNRWRTDDDLRVAGDDSLEPWLAIARDGKYLVRAASML